MRRAIILSFVPISVLAAACGSASSATTTNSTAVTNSTQAAASTAQSGASLALVTTSKYGKVLGSSSNQIYYMFSPDTSSKSACYGSCAGAWPPVIGTVSAPGTGLNSPLVGSLLRTTGQKQLTYGGHPLYTFSGDTGPSLTNGEGINAFGGLWYVINSSGSPVKAATTSGTSSSTTAASYY